MSDLTLSDLQSQWYTEDTGGSLNNDDSTSNLDWFKAITGAAVPLAQAYYSAQHINTGQHSGMMSLPDYAYVNPNRTLTGGLELSKINLTLLIAGGVLILILLIKD